MTHIGPMGLISGTLVGLLGEWGLLLTSRWDSRVAASEGSGALVREGSMAILNSLLQLCLQPACHKIVSPSPIFILNLWLRRIQTLWKVCTRYKEDKRKKVAQTLEGLLKRASLTWVLRDN